MKRILLPVLVCCTALQLTAQDLNTLHNMLIKFYQYQRAGLKSGSANNANSGFTEASHKGDNYNGKPLDGGWYDAGDYIKFGMNLGYSLYCLLKGYDVFPSAYTTSSGSVPDVLVQAKFATDYLCKAVIDNNTVVLDVGVAEDEHGTWGVKYAEGRSGNQIRLCDGGDIPATYAACLALMSVLYRKHDSDYADQCLAKAKTAFAFAKAKFNSNKNYCTPQLKAGAALYDYPTVEGQKNQQINDRMVAAGVELYRATLGTTGADPIYKTWATKSIINFYNCIGYSYIGPLAAYEVWHQGLLTSAGSLNQNLSFIEGKIKTSGTFANVYQNSGWGTARDVGSAALEYALGYVTSGTESTREKYLTRVNDHVNWLTGKSGRSYICGVGSGPTRIHYRTTNYGAVPGAVVSGPDGDGNWSDDGSANYCEVAIDYNAGVVGAVAFLKATSDNSALRVTKVFEADQTVGVDMTTKKVTFGATLSKSVPWTIVITGAFGVKEFSNTGTNINAVWDGSADEGYFLAGEVVKARLEVDGDISALDLQKARPVSVEIIKTVKSPLKTNDKLVDDFEDGDSINKYSGRWTAFGTGIGLTGTSFIFSELESSPSVQLKANVPTPAPDTYSGLRTTFSASGAAGSVGPIKSIVFDMKGATDANVCVELEQSSVTDGAYHQVTFPITKYTNSYRIPIENFAQPDWKTSDVALDLNNIVALRFSVYDSIGRVAIDIDNIYIEDLEVSVNAHYITRKSQAFNTPVYAKGSLYYAIPQSAVGTVNLSIFDLTGRNVFGKQFNGQQNRTVSVDLNRLSAGMYTAVFSDGKSTIGERLKFIMTK
ncbi:MAG: glycoside hydrolase family 9 protein [Chitinispirillaceae bacterium]|nr:glycoside hydrolase family 9 protein [Chitinispirillaceae bacterium]